MNNMRRGFTMIELIFVIVIIGILAAVAIPKLAATRDDARISNIIANTRTALGDMTAYYTSQGNKNWIADATKIGMVTNVGMATTCVAPTPGTKVAGSAFVLCEENGGQTCITLTPDANGSVINVKSGGTGVICEGVASDPAIIAIVGGVSGTDRDHPLGGATVQR